MKVPVGAYLNHQSPPSSHDPFFFRPLVFIDLATVQPHLWTIYQARREVSNHLHTIDHMPLRRLCASYMYFRHPRAVDELPHNDDVGHESWSIVSGVSHILAKSSKFIQNARVVGEILAKYFEVIHRVHTVATRPSKRPAHRRSMVPQHTIYILHTSKSLLISYLGLRQLKPL
jgi:hypothetical protein